MDKIMPLSETEYYLFGQGRFYRAYYRFGARAAICGGAPGIIFTVWAPDVNSVRVVGSFNNWNPSANFMNYTKNGVYTVFVQDAKYGDEYKYAIELQSGEICFKADPFAVSSQLRPATASVIADTSGFKWSDKAWLNKRARTDHRKRPLNIYEVHAGSWKMPGEKNNGENVFYSYDELADMLIPYVLSMGYTHIEFLPLAEHPFDGSWGYQITGFYSPTSRYGTPAGFMSLVNKCHKAGIGVILDWVPGHFCKDAHGLYRFNGKMLYEGAEQAQWGTEKFDFSRPEVRSFLLSNAVYWMDTYHIDGIRVDGVTSMLYLNFGVDSGEKRLNSEGGETDPDAISLLQEFNKITGEYFPGVFTIAEESTAWPNVTLPPDDGGLGFNYKWNMGWMNDTLKYMSFDFSERRYNHNLLTFSMMYAFSENFILPFSHDEVVHGKKSLIGRMPGDYRQQFSGVRLLMLYQMCHPGAKLNFMGNEFSQFIEWRYYEQLEWFLKDYDTHKKNSEFARELNHIFREEKSLYENNYDWSGFKWIDADNSGQSVLSFMRISGRQLCIVILNFGSCSYPSFKIGVPKNALYTELINSDSIEYGGEGFTNEGQITADLIPMHSQPFSIDIRLPSVGGTIIKYVKAAKSRKKAKSSEME